MMDEDKNEKGEDPEEKLVESANPDPDDEPTTEEKDKVSHLESTRLFSSKSVSLVSVQEDDPSGEASSSNEDPIKTEEKDTDEKMETDAIDESEAKVTEAENTETGTQVFWLLFDVVHRVNFLSSR